MINQLIKYLQKRRTIRRFKKIPISKIIHFAQGDLNRENYEQLDLLLIKMQKHRPHDVEILKKALSGETVSIKC